MKLPEYVQRPYIYLNEREDSTPCRILYAGTGATTHLPFFAILSFAIQEPGSPYASVILYILSLNTLARSTKRLLAPLVYLRELY